MGGRIGQARLELLSWMKELFSTVLVRCKAVTVLV